MVMITKSKVETSKRTTATKSADHQNYIGITTGISDNHGYTRSVKRVS